MKIRTQLEDLVRVRPRQGRGEFLRLDMNENPEGLPAAFHRKVRRTLTPELLAMYPEPGELAAELGRTLGIEKDQIFLSNGSDESIKTIFEVFGAEGKAVVTVSPTFEMYGVYAKMFGMVHRAVGYDQSLEVSFSEFLGAIDGETRLVAVLNPNNPIGTVFSEDEVRQVIVRARSVEALVVIDEAYHYFYPDSFLDLVRQFDNVLVTRTFSKLCSIAGLRIGFTVGNVALVAALEKVRQTFNVNSVALRYATAILQEPGLIPRLVEKEREGRAWILAQLVRAGIGHYAENGNYVFILCRQPAKVVAQRLEEGKILVKTYGHPLLSPYVRITTGSVAVMKQFWKAFQSIEGNHVE